MDGQGEKFQSSPDPRAGCDTAMPPMRAVDAWFQSSPDPRVGCDRDGAARIISAPGFQSSPDPRVGCDVARHPGPLPAADVSILTRPAGRVRRVARPQPTHVPDGFNPHPTRGSGATSRPAG